MASTFEEAIRLKFEVAGLAGFSEVEKALAGLGDASEETQAQALALVDAIAKSSDVGQLAAGYRKAGDDLRELDKALRTATESVRTMDTAEKASTAALAEKRAALDAAKATLQSYQDGSHGLIGSTQQIAAAHKAAKADVAALTREVREAERSHKADASALDSSRDALSRTAAQRERALAAVRSYGAQLKAAGVDVTRLSSEEQRLAVEANKAADQLQILADVTRENATVARDAASATDQAAQSQLSLGDAAGKAKVALAAAAASLVGVQRALGSAAADSSEFASAMAKINMQLDDSSHLDAISDGLRRMSREFGGDLIQNATALYETMSKGGEDWAESLELLEHANKLAIAEGEDLVETAKLMRAAMAAYGMEMGESARVADQLSYAISIGNTNLSQMAATLPRVASLAATAGVSFDELTTAIGTLTTGGLPAAEAGTALVGMLQAIIKPSREAQKLAKDLGLEFNTTALATKGLAGFLQDVVSKTKGADTALATLFGSVNGLNGVLQLGGNLAQTFATDLGNLGTAAGRAAANFEKFGDTPAQKMALFEAALKDLRISLGDVVTAFTPVLDLATGAVNAFNELPAPIRAGTASLAAFAGVAGSLLLAARALGPGLKALGLAMPAVGTGAAGAAKGVGVLGTALKGLGVTMALGFAIDKVAEAYTAISGLVEVNKQVAEAERDLRTVRAEQMIQIDRLKEQYGELADAQIRNADLLASMSESDLSVYLNQLDGAGKYWRAIEIEARNAGDAQSQAFARERADQFAQVAVNVRDRLAEVRAQLDGIADAATVAFAKVHQELFTAATTAGKLSTALDTAFKDRSFQSTADEVGQIALALAQVSSYAEQSDKVVREGLEASLTKLAGRDLLLFRDAAKAAFDEAGTAAGTAAAVMETVIASAMTQLGLSAQAAGRQITAEGENVIALFEVVAQSGTASADQVEQAFKAALGRLSTSGEAEALGEALKAAGEQGAIGAEAADRAMAALKRRIDELKQAAAPLADAFSQLGIKSQAELQRAAAAAKDAFDQIVDGMRRGQTAQEDVIRAFEAYAQAARAAVDDSSEATKQQLELQLQAQAAALGLSEKLQQAGEAGKQTGEKTAEAMGKAKKAMDDVAEGAEKVAEATQRAARSVDDVMAGLGDVTTGMMHLDAYGTQALRTFTDLAIRGQDLSKLAPATAEYLLDNVGGMLGAQAQVLRKVIDDAKRAQEEAVRAAEAVDDQIARLEERILARSGNEVAIENNRIEQERRRLAALEAEAKAAGWHDADRFARLRQLSEQDHRERMAEIEAERKARMQAEQDIQRQKDRAERPPLTPAPAPASQPQPSTSTRADVAVSLKVTNDQLPGGVLLNLRKQDLQHIAESVLRELSIDLRRSA